jgi:protein-L-isoaspartate(D-aspartate) O-methyltransferase
MHHPSQASAWRQVNLWCQDWQTAEAMAITRLHPLLTTAEDSGLLTAW